MITCPACQTPSDGSQKFCPKCGAMLPAETGPDPLVGQIFGGKYRIVKLLGEGGMGAVYLGEQQMGTKVRNVAIKTLHKHLSQDPHIKARFMRECGTVSELEHPNTIQVYDYGSSDDGLLYIVMEYVQGQDVATVLEKTGPMPPERVQRILTQVCGSLEEAHKKGIVHRDLKPENVVLCERAGQTDWVEVLDFGIAKRQEDSDPNEQKLTQQGMVLGTPPYMSPEQFTGKPIDARSDIYSLGVMAYEMLTGKLPFVAQTAWEWATQHMTAQPIDIESHPMSSAMPPHMKAAVKKAMEKLPEQRFSSVREFIDAFAAGNAQAIGAPPVGGTAVLGPPPSTAGFVREKTQMGEPLMAPPGAGGPSFGPAVPTGPTSGPMTPMGPGPGAAPPAPPVHAQPQASGGGGRGPLLAIIGVLAVLSIVGIVLGVTQPWKKKGGPSGGLDFDAGSGTVVDMNTEDAGQVAANTDTTPDAGSGLSALSSAKTSQVTFVAPKKDGGGGTVITPGVKDAGGGTVITPIPTNLPPVCQNALRMKEKGKMADYESLKKACILAGGKID